jgi:hypothetical protein
MSTIIATNTLTHAIEDSGSTRAGLFRRVVDAIVEARTREAERRVAAQFAAVSDQYLSAIGFSPTEIILIRAGEPVGNILAQRARRPA